MMRQPNDKKYKWGVEEEQGKAEVFDFFLKAAKKDKW